jgi:rhomboid protease GluP
LATFEKAWESARASLGASVFGVTAAPAACAVENTECGWRAARPTAVPSTANDNTKRRGVRVIAFLCIELDELSSRAGCPPASDFCWLEDTFRAALDNCAPPVKNSSHDMRWFRGLKQAPVTAALIAVNVLVYLVMAAVSRHLIFFDNATMISAGASVTAPDVIASHWRWVTAAFVHANLLHIFMNMWVLGQIGAISEKALGRGLFAATYLVTGFLGNVLSSVLAQGPTVSVGASGAIMGLIGMAATFAWRSGQKRAARALAFNILFVLGVGLSLSARGVHLVDNAAHIGGLVAGAVVGLIRVSARRPMPVGLDRALVASSFGLAAVAFAVVQVVGP